MDSGNGRLYVMMTAETFLKFFCEWMGAVQDCYILDLRGVNDALRRFGKAEARDVVYASYVEYKEIKPTHDVQSKACTERSVKVRKHWNLQIKSPVLDDRDIAALPDIGKQGQFCDE